MDPVASHQRPHERVGREVLSPGRIAGQDNEAIDVAVMTLVQGGERVHELDHNTRVRARGYRHELAHHLTQGGAYELALPMPDAILSTGDHFGGGYGWLMHAAAVWQVRRDRPRALALLRDAKAHDGRDLVDQFLGNRAFAGVTGDPEFLEAISRRSS